VLLGFSIFLTILAPALLHTNQYEFIVERFSVDLLNASYFDTVLYASYLIIGILTAILSNKVGKRRVFVSIGAFGSAIFYYLLTTTLNYPLLLLFRFIQGGFTVLVWQTIMTMVLDQSTASNRGKNMGIFGIFLVLSMGSGPVLGGIFAGFGVLVPYFVAIILSFIVFFLSLFLLQEPAQVIPKPTLKENLSILLNKPRLIVPSIFNFVDRLHMGFILFLLPLVLQIELEVSPELRGMVLGLYALPYILLQYPVGRWSDRIGRYKPLILGSIFTGIILSVIGFLSSFGLFVVIIGFILLGLGNGITGPPAMALVGDMIEKNENAVGMGFFNLFGNIGIICGPILGGFLADNTNFVTSFVIAGLIEFVSLASAILILIMVFKEIPWLIKPIQDSDEILSN
jgi:MFS family permease